MRNLIVFIIKYHLILLFVLLESISLYLLVSNNYYHQSVFIRSTNEIIGNFYKKINNINEYFGLKETNYILAQENARLRSELKNSFIVSPLQVMIKEDTLYRQQYKYIEAKIIKNSINKRNNYLIIDKGKLQGVQKDMAVITSNGIAGIVTEVSNNFSTIMSLLHKDSKVSAMIKKNKYKGTLVWDGTDYKNANLIDIEPHVKLAKGDTIITSGNSYIFPEGLLIGVIDKFSIVPGAYYYDISLKFTTDYSRLEYVYIVNNLYKYEQKKLIDSKKDE